MLGVVTVEVDQQRRQQEEQDVADRVDELCDVGGVRVVVLAPVTWEDMLFWFEKQYDLSCLFKSQSYISFLIATKLAVIFQLKLTFCINCFLGLV